MNFTRDHFKSEFLYFYNISHFKYRNKILKTVVSNLINKILFDNVIT